jgi:hypothetical protein
VLTAGTKYAVVVHNTSVETGIHWHRTKASLYSKGSAYSYTSGGITTPKSASAPGKDVPIGTTGWNAKSYDFHFDAWVATDGTGCN